MNTVTVRVQKRGVITIPAKLREKYDIQEGQIFSLLDLDGLFVLSPGVSEVEKNSRRIEKIRVEEGVSLQELLNGLRVERDRYYQERYSQEEGE